MSRFLNSEQGRLQMIEKAKTTSGLYTLSAGKVASLEVPVPLLFEQKNATASLNEQISSAERTRKVLEDQLATINKLPAALLRGAFSASFESQVSNLTDT